MTPYEVIHILPYWIAPPNELPRERFILTKIALVIMSFVHAPLPSRANVYWNGGSSSDWSTAANWSRDLVPGSGNNVLIVVRFSIIHGIPYRINITTTG